MTTETQSGIRPTNEPGRYRHESGAELVATREVQADAMVRLGYKRVGSPNMKPGGKEEKE